MLTLAACGGGDEKLETGSVTVEDLPLMVLPQESLGEEFADFTPTSYWVHNDAAAARSYDPRDTASDLDARGRLDGFEWSYADRQLSAFERGEGAGEVGTMVELFEDEESASKHLTIEVSAYERFRNQELEGGLVVHDSHGFEVGEIGDEARGVTAVVEAKRRGSLTYVFFRVGRLVGTAWVGRADEEDVTDQVERIARLLARQIEAEIQRGDATDD